MIEPFNECPFQAYTCSFLIAVATLSAHTRQRPLFFGKLVKFHGLGQEKSQLREVSILEQTQCRLSLTITFAAIEIRTTDLLSF